VITANSGNDTLVAGAGLATLVGGTGNDTFVINNASDVITEQSNSGTDTVKTTVSYVLPANVENITATGTANVTLTGNGLTNVITANSGNDTLIAGAGNCTLISGAGVCSLVGGTGDNTFVVNNTSDIITAKSTAVKNTIQTSVSYMASANVKYLTGTGSAAITLTGNSLANVITANSGNDTLVAGTGVATLVGGVGDNTFVVNNVGDVIVEQANGGNDTIQSSVTYVMPANVEVLSLTGTGTLTGTANNMNVLMLASTSGSSATDTLKGGAGIDVLEGGSGKDTITDTLGKAAIIGGTLADTITTGAFNDFIAGGKGGDAITVGAGKSVLAVNVGDGADTVTGTAGSANVLSLGGTGLNYNNMSFSKSSSNLVLSLGNGDSVTFVNWYASTNAVHDFATLQVIEQASTSYNPTSTNVLVNKKVEEFDFANLVSQFDTALAANNTLTSWSLMNGLPNAHLSGSDTAALGGDLAYYEGTRGSLAGMNLAAAQTVLSSSQFGTGAQTINAWQNISQSGTTLR
jgi:trimeric autotransporter adhesin